MLRWLLVSFLIFTGSIQAADPNSENTVIFLYAWRNYNGAPRKQQITGEAAFAAISLASQVHRKDKIAVEDPFLDLETEHLKFHFDLNGVPNDTEQKLIAYLVGAKVAKLKLGQEASVARVKEILVPVYEEHVKRKHITAVPEWLSKMTFASFEKDLDSLTKETFKNNPNKIDDAVLAVAQELLESLEQFCKKQTLDYVKAHPKITTIIAIPPQGAGWLFRRRTGV